MLCLLLYALWMSHKAPRDFMAAATKLIQCLDIHVPQADLLTVCTVFLSYESAHTSLRSLCSDYLLSSQTAVAEEMERLAMEEAERAEREARQQLTDQARENAAAARAHLDEVRSRVMYERETLEAARVEAERAH